MRFLALIAFSALVASVAVGQSGGTTGGQNPFQGGTTGSTTQPPTRRAEPSVERRLALLEEQAEAMLKEIKALRAQVKAGTQELRTFRLKHASADRVGAILNEVFRREEGTRFTIDERTNSLIFFATKDKMDLIQSLLAHLDTPVEKK